MPDKEVDFKYKTLEEAKKGYAEVYTAYQKGQEEGNLTKKDLEATRAELQKLQGAIQEREKREEQLRNRLRQPGISPEQRQRVNEQFLEQMRNDPVGTVDSRIAQIIQRQGYVKKEDIDKQGEVEKAEEENFNKFVSSHEDFEEVRPTFTKLWNKLPQEQRKTSSLDLIFKAAKGEIASGKTVDLDEEKKKMREEIIRELKEKATLSGGRKIKTKKELEEDEKAVDNIVNAHKSSKVTLNK